MKCPGQDMQYWDEDAIYEVTCPQCSKNVEFYKDDTTRKCGSCGHRFVNPKMDFGCAAYCQFAEQCLGTLPEEFVLSQDSLLKDKVAVEVKRRFKNDFAGIRLATKIAGFAETIAKTTQGADMARILCSAFLLTAGAPDRSEKEEKASIEMFGDASLRAAREILGDLGAQQQLTDSVCDTIAKVAESAVETDDLSTQVVHDAYHLALLERFQKNESLSEDVCYDFSQKLFTDQARNEAERIADATHA